jgi:hypothetical protein
VLSRGLVAKKLLKVLPFPLVFGALSCFLNKQPCSTLTVWWKYALAPLPTPQKYKKSDNVKVLATEFDNESRDRAGMNFSERWAADGVRIYGAYKNGPQIFSD